MQAVLHVSKATTQEIINELCSIYSVVEECTPKPIDSVVIKLSCAINSEVTTAVTEIVQEVDLFSLLSKELPFGLDFKQTTYYKSHFKVIKLIKYVLDASSRQKLAHIPRLF